MKLTNLKVNDIFNTNGKFTFLVGAGCSINSPSCLPAGYEMMEAIIDHACDKSEREGILELIKLGELRFETLVEIFRDSLDQESKFASRSHGRPWRTVAGLQSI